MLGQVGQSISDLVIQSYRGKYLTSGISIIEFASIVGTDTDC